ncbi:MAG: GTPase ObgE [Actinobacteria bacterium]|nr:MAG: GTPase ObgE [Actinomycetota bacterium]RIK07542.1 MAG: GTPase ObgE [Acidobacteriota bacterium]
MSEFVDEAAICVRGGAGGAGCVSFRREAHVSRGGPDGGDGGSGGDVWLVADSNTASLLSFRDHPHRRAADGTHGQGKRRHGTRGEDLFVAVPEGTVVLDRDGTVVADLTHAGDRWLAAPGGRGGRGNARFLSNRRRAPSFAEQGEQPEEAWLRLELKLVADAALVGFPNVGKSTLISRVSAAKPKIADYPFTTLQPHLGVVRTDDGRELVLADVPGLIEGASDGKGLGDRFLRHVERARVLVLLLDLAMPDGTTPSEQETVLLRELQRYQPRLLERPRLVVGSRCDLVASGTTPEFDRPRISSVTGEGLSSFVGRLADLVESARESEVPAETFVVHRPLPGGVTVARRDDGSFEVLGRSARRAVALSDLTNPEALDFAQTGLRRLGVYRALARAGAEAGDTVHIGGLDFEYQPEVADDGDDRNGEVMS